VAENIRLIEEDQAQGRVHDIYYDIRRTMGTPLVGDIFRAFAAFPPFLEVVWWEIKPLIGGAVFEGLADRLRAHALACSRQHLYMPDHSKALAARGLDEAEVARIRDVVEVFYETDPRLLAIATIVHESLTTGPVGATVRRHTGYRANPPLVAAPLKLASPAAAPGQVRIVFDDVKLTLGLPVVPSAFRALARWPDYLQMAWEDVKGQARTAEFRRHVDEIRDIAVAGLRELPRPVRVDATTVRGAGVRQEQLSQVYELADLLQSVQPKHVGVVTLLRLGLNSTLEEKLLELEAGA